MILYCVIFLLYQVLLVYKAQTISFIHDYLRLCLPMRAVKRFYSSKNRALILAFILAPSLHTHTFMFVFFSTKIFFRGSHQYNIKTLKIFCCIRALVIYNLKMFLKLHSVFVKSDVSISYNKLPWISKVLLYMVEKSAMYLF